MTIDRDRLALAVGLAALAPPARRSHDQRFLLAVFLPGYDEELVATKKSEGRAKVTRWAVFPRRAFDAAVKAAGLVGSPHKLRHSYASWFLAAGGDMFTLSRILGHASIRTTEKVYAHFQPEHLDKARGRINLGPATVPAARLSSDGRRGDSRHGARRRRVARRGRRLGPGT
jgi:integrase/recombinase XerD